METENETEKDETEETIPGEETPEENSPEEKPAESPKSEVQSNELKIVIFMKDDRFMLGVQSPNCDPFYESLTGSIDTALQRIPGMVQEAKDKWLVNPRNPKANLPPPPPPPVRNNVQPVKQVTKPKQKETTQNSFF